MGGRGGGRREERPGLSKDSVPMAASFQNSLGMKNNENHRGKKSLPGRRVPASGLVQSPFSWLSTGASMGLSTGDLSFPPPHPFLSSSQACEWCRPSAGSLPGLQGEGATHAALAPWETRETWLGEGVPGTRLEGKVQGTMRRLTQFRGLPGRSHVQTEI